MRLDILQLFDENILKCSFLQGKSHMKTKLYTMVWPHNFRAQTKTVLYTMGWPNNFRAHMKTVLYTMGWPQTILSTFILFFNWRFYIYSIQTHFPSGRLVFKNMKEIVGVLARTWANRLTLAEIWKVYSMYTWDTMRSLSSFDRGARLVSTALWADCLIMISQGA